MKVLLFAENMPMDLSLLAEYYEAKGLPYWVYICDRGLVEYRRATADNLNRSLVPPDAFVSLKDYGDIPSFNKDWYEIKNRRNKFIPNRYRLNKDFIRLVEAKRYRYNYFAKVVDVPAGVRFKATFKNGFEELEYENKVHWFTSEED